MDTSEYMPMFLAESREHLQELNLAVVQLEEHPESRETIDQIFRIAHSLKGMSATMGFAAIAELTHQMEDVFELLRQRKGPIEGNTVDTLLACLDALSEAIESIESSGREQLDPAPLIVALHQLVRDHRPEQPSDHAGAPAVPEIAALQAARDCDNRILHVVATLDDEVMMPAVRAYMVFAALAACGELIAGIPSHEGAEQFTGNRIEAWLASDETEESVAETARGVSDVKSVIVCEDNEDRPAAPTAALIGAPSEGTPAAALQAEASTVAAVQQATRTVRVDAERLDQLMHLMGELVIHRTAVEAQTASIGSPELHHAVANLTRSSQALQSMVMQVRMIPVEVVFMRFPRVVRDLSTKLGKEVELELIGRDTELDRTVVDALGDPLVHLVRNSLDHGLELAASRLAAGKPRVGKLTIAARHAGGSVIIEVRDDGRGVDPGAIARKAVAAGLIDPDQAAAIDMRGAIELLFQAGLSTAETTSDVSGRGVGMDAVRAKIRALGGEVLMESTLGAGTLAQIRLPLTLAIVSALQIDVAGAPFAIPLDRVERTLRIDQHSVRSVAGRRMLYLDTGVLPLLEGASTFERTPLRPHQLAVIVRGGDRRIGLAVDELVGQRELVTRPLPAIVSDGQPVSGGAVLADGQIALIIDCDALASRLFAQSGTSPKPTQIAA